MSRFIHRIRFGIAGVILAALPGLAAARPVATQHLDTPRIDAPRAKARKIVAEYDLNGDRHMSGAEWRAARHDQMVRRLRALDRNRNGFISRFEAWLQPETRVYRYFSEIDRNHDRRISLAELLASPDMLWGRKGTRELVKRYGPPPF